MTNDMIPDNKSIVIVCWELFRVEIAIIVKDHEVYVI
jgi:hypothetical protein